ncbi:hypothetical protein IMCC1933_13890 [Rhodobacteraceae bacterium IMCC1933]|nr:hypothetical protein [Rhodobacteraceae bacterium IMCC1923]MDP4067843.1 hypothetical protein [Rhodobacteraceae bacterium IMCC1933]MDP4071216.1 hypothetical protein [Rhodobacteraceae bacterium IMCC1909]
MVAVNYTVAFHAAEARPVEVQCAVAPGLASFQIIGLANKAVSEAHERVRAALDALSIALPSKRITVNLSPADMPKGGSHFDLPIVVALLSALGMIPQEEIGACVLMGELALGGYLEDPAKACARAPDCGADYLGRISGPLLDRFDLRVDVPPVAYSDLELPCDSAPSAEVALRITAAHTRQSERYAKIPNCMVNADAEGAVLQAFATPNADG